jgi:hypothetical protein
MSLWKRFVSCADSHGDMQDDLAVEAFFKFVEAWKPDLRIHKGDIWDFRPLRKAAKEDEKRESLAADKECGQLFIQRYQPTHISLGNHDIRLWDLARYGVGIFQDYAHQGIREIEQLFADLRCAYVTYDSRLGYQAIGDYGWIHGYTSGVNALRIAMNAYSCKPARVLAMGHVHTAERISGTTIDEREGYVCPCLCKLDMDYNRAQLNKLRQRHGWLYGVIHELTGACEVWQVKGLDGKWFLPTGFEEL